MGLYRWIKKRLENGRAREFLQECRWVWQYVCRYRSAVAAHVLLGVAGIVMTLASSVAGKVLIDAVIGHSSGRIGRAAAFTVGLRLGSILMKSIAARISARINIRVQNEIQHELYCRVLATDWQSLEAFRSGDLLNRISSDASTVAGGVTGFLPALISCAVQFAGSFVIILWHDPVMALITLVGVPVTGLCSTVLLHKMRRHSKEMKDLYGEVMSFQQESFQNMTVIKSFGMTDLFGERMERMQQRYRERYLDHSRFSVWTSALMNLLSLLAYIGCFGWGVYRLWNGQITYGEMTLFLQLSSMLGAAFSSLIGLVPNAISISTSARRVMTVVQLPAEDTRPAEGFATETEFTLQLRGVDFRYRGGAPVLQQVDLTARPGELICLTGPSGEGKTTLLRVMLGLVAPTAGEACLMGADGTRYPLTAATRSAFGYVPQGNQIFAGTVAENLRMSCPHATDEELLAALKAACAYDFVMALPGKLEHPVGGRDKRLSEGQAQRLAVARALLRRAPILLLDEATSALDADTEQKLLHNLMASGMVRTCILVTHRPAARQFCSRGYHIREGVVREEAAL